MTSFVLDEYLENIHYTTPQYPHHRILPLSVSYVEHALKCYRTFFVSMDFFKVLLLFFSLIIQAIKIIFYSILIGVYLCLVLLYYNKSILSSYHLTPSFDLSYLVYELIFIILFPQCLMFFYLLLLVSVLDKITVLVIVFFSFLIQLLSSFYWVFPIHLIFHIIHIKYQNVNFVPNLLMDNIHLMNYSLFF